MFMCSAQRPLRYTIRHFLAFIIMSVLTLCFWQYHHDLHPDWRGVPTVPSYTRIINNYLGDQQLGYRAMSIKIQNFGDTGGQTISIKNFDYDQLFRWFSLGTQLDARSNYLPSLAAYYYGAIDDEEKLRHVVDYLSEVGNSAENGKWRWLAQAVFLARFKIEDQELALNLAYKLAALEGDQLPIWTDQMPAFVLAKVGEEKAALDIITTIMATDKTLVQNEINYMCWYMSKKIGISIQALNKNEIFQSFCIGRDF